MNGISIVFFSGLLSVLGVNSDLTDRVEYTCAKPTWSREPVVSNGMFKGTLTSKCKFTTDSEGDYRKLAEFAVDSVKKNALEIHSGPVDKEMDGMPGVEIDATLPIKEEGLESVRYLSHMATDGKTRMVLSNRTKKITASGMASNLKKLDNDAILTRGRTTNSHEVSLVLTSHVNKPGLVPAGMFKRTVMEEMEKQMKAREKQAILELAKNMQ